MAQLYFTYQAILLPLNTAAPQTLIFTVYSSQSSCCPPVILRVHAVLGSFTFQASITFHVRLVSLDPLISRRQKPCSLPFISVLLRLQHIGNRSVLRFPLVHRSTKNFCQLFFSAFGSFGPVLVLVDQSFALFEAFEWCYFNDCYRTTQPLAKPCFIPHLQTKMATSQLWFLISESVKSTSFKQVKMSIEEIVEIGISLPKILQSLSLSGVQSEYTFFIHSSSMSASVQMLTDQAIHGTWHLYCTGDSIVTITVRKSDEASPNTSRAPSYSQALTQRRQVSGGLQVPSIPITEPPRQVSSGLDAVEMEPIADLPEHEKVLIRTSTGSAQEFSREYLICKSSEPGLGS